jgi:hypothetical protein
VLPGSNKPAVPKLTALDESTKSISTPAELSPTVVASTHDASVLAPAQYSSLNAVTLYEVGLPVALSANTLKEIIVKARAIIKVLKKVFHI